MFSFAGLSNAATPSPRTPIRTMTEQCIWLADWRDRPNFATPSRAGDGTSTRSARVSEARRAPPRPLVRNGRARRNRTNAVVSGHHLPAPAPP